VYIRGVPTVLQKFSLSDVEQDRLLEWVSGHQSVCSAPSKKPRLSYEFTPTGLGTKVIVKCLHCGVRHEVTDYGCW
jgi:uncharacterized protein CbrC (UPF0167 family)